jgi:long-chain acyl-CoA synthetase
VRRRVIVERYAPYIDAIYAGDDEVEVSTTITYENGQQATVRSQVRIEDPEREALAHA